MSTTATHTSDTNVSFWRKSLDWIRAFEEATDYDPAQASINLLNGQVIKLKDKVSNLEAQLGGKERNQ